MQWGKSVNHFEANDSQDVHEHDALTFDKHNATLCLPSAGLRRRSGEGKGHSVMFESVAHGPSLLPTSPSASDPIEHKGHQNDQVAGHRASDARVGLPVGRASVASQGVGGGADGDPQRS